MVFWILNGATFLFRDSRKSFPFLSNDSHPFRVNRLTPMTNKQRMFDPFEKKMVKYKTNKWQHHKNVSEFPQNHLRFYIDLNDCFFEIRQVRSEIDLIRNRYLLAFHVIVFSILQWNRVFGTTHGQPWMQQQKQLVLKE